MLVIHDIGLFQGEPYIVSELLQGATLRKRLDGKPLPPAKAIDWALQLAQGLRAAHDSCATAPSSGVRIPCGRLAVRRSSGRIVAPQ